MCLCVCVCVCVYVCMYVCMYVCDNRYVWLRVSGPFSPSSYTLIMCRLVLPTVLYRTLILISFFLMIYVRLLTMPTPLLC